MLCHLSRIMRTVGSRLYGYASWVSMIPVGYPVNMVYPDRADGVGPTGTKITPPLG